MVTAEWSADVGWGVPMLKPYQKIELEPSAVVFHYGFEVGPGPRMKAYKDKAGNIRLFRPDMNMARMNRSAARIALPVRVDFRPKLRSFASAKTCSMFDGKELIECIKELVRTDSRWVPAERGYSLYLRPTLIGTQESLGVGPTNRALLFVIACPVGPYYKTGFAAVSLLATIANVRAWPGGTGDTKIGGNYAPCVRPQVNAMAKGYQQNLWLFGPEHEVTEVGTMNAFVFWTNRDGQRELVTPPLDGSILPGITRDSILALAREWNEFKVSERKFTMKDIKAAAAEGRLIEMFGAGTACIVSPIKTINYLGVDMSIPLDPKDPNSQAGPLAKRFNDTLLGIQVRCCPLSSTGGEACMLLQLD
ncbi:MAG: aminotransferase [Olpidium bornovanus]|uniref:Branched-chain-amino-acid aminotransferase n=1 Tax=Olpidium bornovanus TaxID=278681 RepID=A0A8H7ZY68_9FUNG|nr:MAG: aminotransferase [Olpidium bornovanus]